MPEFREGRSPGDLGPIFSVNGKMPHVSNIVYPEGPDAPHAFDIISLKPRNGTLDAECPVCKGHGEWNAELDLVSFRCKRVICGRCLGAGWVETGTDPVAFPDIELSAEGYPRWTTRYVPRDAVQPDELSESGSLANKLTPKSD